MVGVLLGKNNKAVNPFLFLMNPSFFFSSLFSEEKFIDFIPYFLFITKSFSLDTSDKTTSWITSSYLTVCYKKVYGKLHPSVTAIISSQCNYLYLTSTTFWWGRFFSNSINITFTLCINQFLLLNTVSFIFLKTFLLINSIFAVLGRVA